MSIQGTKTEQNLREALIGESLARNKYSVYAETARKAGLDQAADTFERLAKNEMMHAKFWFKLLYGEQETRENLIEAAEGEFSEWHGMYPAFAAQAREDGEEDLAVMFERVAAIEKDHERQFLTLVAQLAGGGAPEAESEIREGWRCQFCGAVFDHMPNVCETCQAIGSFDPITWEEQR